MDVITTTQELAQACTRLAQHPYVTVDTEFLRESTYFPILCVAQMASEDEAAVIDTRAAAMVLGYGDSISYDQLVHRITGDNLDKSHRFTDWTRRPLTNQQIAYAISD